MTDDDPFRRRLGMAPPRGPPPEVWAPGYTRGELEAAQARFGLAFPPDLIELLLERRPRAAPDWRTDEQAIRDRLAWPFEGLLFDVEKNGLWWPEWGERPATPAARAEVLRAVVAAAPPLIPIYSHRYIPAEPLKAGNPVFSVHQSDVIYYGADLADYLAREFEDPRRPLGDKIRRIRFWSDLVERSGDERYYPYD
jgi:hypothetical protein